MNLRQAHIVLWSGLFLVMIADIGTTILALGHGAFEVNQVPAWLQGFNIILWPAVLLAGMGVTYYCDLMIKRKWGSDIGIILFPIPILIELQAVINNIQVLWILIGM